MEQKQLYVRTEVSPSSFLALQICLVENPLVLLTPPPLFTLSFAGILPFTAKTQAK